MQPGHVEHVLQAFAHRLQDDRELAVLARHLQQLIGALPLLPQGRPPARIPPRKQQGPGRAFPESRREQRRSTHLGRHHRLDLVGIEDDEVRAGRLGVGVGQPYHDAVVGMHGLDLEPVPLTQPRADRQRPRRIDRRPER